MDFDITRGNPRSWMKLLWYALHSYHEELDVPDQEWDDICTVMAWLAEDLGIEEDNLDHQQLNDAG
jgi:hypothetical protein